jgi:hypothetical protein
MWPQMWAGGSQLGFAFEQAFAGSSDPFAKTNTDPAGGHSQRQQSPTEEKKQRLKRKLRVPRKKSQEQQLEIDISLNEKDDASDS